MQDPLHIGALKKESLATAPFSVPNDAPAVTELGTWRNQASHDARRRLAGAEAPPKHWRQDDSESCICQFLNEPSAAKGFVLPWQVVVPDP